MSTHPNHNSCKKIDFSGLQDSLICSLAHDLNADRAGKKLAMDQMEYIPMKEMSPAELWLLLTKIVECHPEAEKQVARLILKHLGINKSTFWGSSVIDIAASSGDGDNESVLSLPLPLQHSDDTDILPNLSPVPWLSEES